MSGTRSVDINADLGEGFGRWRLGADEELMPMLTSANIACGFHAGDPETMLRTIRLAQRHGVRIGAHPGTPDLLGFGRRRMDLSASECHAYVLYQMAALKGMAEACGAELHHVKSHGAMYEMLRDPALAGAMADAIVELAPGARAYFPGPLERHPFTIAAAERGLEVVAEIYPDLQYSDDGSLLVTPLLGDRVKQGTDLDFVRDQVTTFITEGQVMTERGTTIPMEARSICVHGDGPNVLEVTTTIREVLAELGCGLGLEETEGG
jgi:UPF0271 protein